MLLIVSAGPSIVPRLMGLPLAVAEKRLRGGGHEAAFPRRHLGRDAGVVVATEPEPGEPEVPGATVTVSVSSGPGRIAAPSLLWFSAAGGGSRSVALPASSRGCSRCPRRSPPARSWRRARSGGVELGGGSSPHRRLDRRGSGRPGASANGQVPNWSGSALAAAQDQLEARGSSSGSSTRTARAPLGEVLSRTRRPRRPPATARTCESWSPPAGSVRLIGGDRARGLLEDGATSAIETAGFAPRVRRERTPDPAEVGVVVRQEPEAHRQAPQGGPITIYVGAPVGLEKVERNGEPLPSTFLGFVSAADRPRAPPGCCS